MYTFSTSWFLSISFAINKDVSYLLEPFRRVWLAFTVDLIWLAVVLEIALSSPIIITSLGFKRFNSDFTLLGTLFFSTKSIGALYVVASGVDIMPSILTSPFIITTLSEPFFQPSLLILTAVSYLSLPVSSVIGAEVFLKYLFTSFLEVISSIIHSCVTL